MVFTIRPCSTQASAKPKSWPMAGTVVTQDRSLSAQWEHMVAVTDNGYEVLTAWQAAPASTAHLSNHWRELFKGKSAASA